MTHANTGSSGQEKRELTLHWFLFLPLR